MRRWKEVQLFDKNKNNTNNRKAVESHKHCWAGKKTDIQIPLMVPMATYSCHKHLFSLSTHAEGFCSRPFSFKVLPKKREITAVYVLFFHSRRCRAPQRWIRLAGASTFAACAVPSGSKQRRAQAGVMARGPGRLPCLCSL